jgi:monoamine oxidase
VTEAARIVPLTGLHHLAPVLAAWHHAEWGHLYPDDVWNHAIAVREFATMADPGSRDQTWVAFDGDDRDGAALLGSVSLLATDDLAGFEHLTPWLASLFVTPTARGWGVAAALVDEVLRTARADGHDVVHLFTSGQQRYWADRGWSVVAAVDTEGHPATVMARSTHPRGARRAVCSTWCSDPDHQGAYSHLRANGTPAHRERLAQQILPGLWFAGEATSAAYPATMHGAWLSGERAADQVLASSVLADPAASRVAVIGAGLAGLAAARRLQAEHRQVVVIESKSVAGGRIVSDRSTGAALPLGGAWLHGDQGHPLRDLVSTVPEPWDRPAFFVAGIGRIGTDDTAAVTAAYEMLHRAFADAEPGVTVATVVERTLADAALPPLVRDTVTAWITAECEGLYGAPLDEMPANGGYEPFELPGGDHLVTSDLGALAEHLAAGLDVRFERRVGHLRADGPRWCVDDDLVVDAVIVTVPIGALAAGRIAFSPTLPDDVRRAVASIGSGPIAKVFATFDTVWWPDDRPFRLAGSERIGTFVDMSATAGRPTLVGFAVGEHARAVEHLGEHELCRLVDRELAVLDRDDRLRYGCRRGIDD